jgi:GTPase
MQVRAVRTMLKDTPDSSTVRQTDSLNVQKKPKSRTDAANLADYRVEADLAAERTWYVHGHALERFAQMTDWNFFEASLRFQRVLRRVGLWADLEKRGILEGDTVVIGASAFTWSSDQSERKVFEAWKSTAGLRTRGATRWPHASV